MPCYYTGSAEGDARLDAEIARKELTETTELLCKTMKWLEVNNMQIPEFAKNWWKKHQKSDKKGRP